MIQEVKDLRIRIDGLAQLTKELKPMNHPPVIVKTIYGALGSNFPVDCITDIKANSKEIERSADSLYLAKAWLGKVLGELGEETPYKNDGNRKTVEDIEETTDTDKIKIKVEDKNYYYKYSESIQQEWFTYRVSHIEKVDWLRQQIQDIFNELDTKDFYGVYFDSDMMGDNYCNYFYQHLLEARFWLGFELERIKNEE